MSEQEAPTGPTAVEREATALGWVPLEKFRGGESRWVDAETFVERGHQVMPILQRNNQRLLADLATAQGVAEEAKTAAAELRTTVDNLTKFQRDEVKRQVDAEVARIRVDLKAAKVAGNVELEVDLEEALDLAKDRQRVAATPPPPPPPPAKKPDVTIDLDIKAWTEENEWFGPKGDKRKTALVMAAAEEINSKTGMKGRALLEAAALDMEETLGISRSSTSKTEETRGGDGGRGGGRSNGTSFSDLPADAKAQAVKEESKYVGPNKAFKTVKEWHNHYAGVYFNG